MAASPVFLGNPRSEIANIVNGHSTRPVVVFVAGSSGSRVYCVNVTSTDAGANEAILYICKPMTLQSAMGTGAHVDGGGGSDTITRSSGSFVTDGWKVGDRLLVAGSTTLANDYLIRLTGVAAGTLTFATATVNTAENLPTGAILYKVCQLVKVTVPLNAGNAAGEEPISLINPAYMPAIMNDPNGHIKVAALYALAVACTTQVSTSEEFEILVNGDDY